MKRVVYRIRSGRDLPGLSSDLHDSWLRVPQANVFEKPESIEMEGWREFGDTRRLRTFGPLVKVEESLPHVVLMVNQTRWVYLDDIAGTGHLNLADITYDPDAKRVTVTGHIPTAVHFGVDQLDIALAVDYSNELRRYHWRCRVSRWAANSSPRAEVG